MKGIVYLATRYLAYHRIKSTILVLSVTLIIFLPVGLNVLVEKGADELTARADVTPLLVGAKGSPLELVLNSLYFETETPATMSYAEAIRISETKLAVAIPLYVWFRSRDYPIVGTTLEYFDYRGLRFATGRAMAVLGECVLGSAVARELDVGPGDSVVSSPETVFDLAGVYPLKMRVAGVLRPSFTPDDEAIFVDVKTAWILEGLGHGHQDLSTPEAASAVLAKEENTITANASVLQYNEITSENIDSFHFHGDPSGFPLTAVIAVPDSDKSAVILRGRYEGAEELHQIVRPRIVIDELLDTVLTVQTFVVTAVVIVALSTVATAILVFMLSIRLRRREITTMRKIGASRLTVLSVLGSEILAVLVISLMLAAGLTVLTAYLGSTIIRTVLLS